MAQWVGRAPNGADTFGTHYSEFEVEIGALGGKEQARILREIRATLAGSAAAASPGVTFAVNTFLTERIEETIAGFAAPLVINLYGTDLDLLDRDAQAVAGALSRVPGARDVQVQAPPGTPQIVVRLRPGASCSAGASRRWTRSRRSSAAYRGRGSWRRCTRATTCVNLVVVLAPEVRNRSIAQIGRLQLRAADGRLVRAARRRRYRAHERPLQDPALRRTRGFRPSPRSVAGRDLQDFEADARRAHLAKEVKLCAGQLCSCSAAPRGRRRRRART